MALTFTWYWYVGKTANIVDFVILNGRLAGSIQNTRVYRSAFIDIKIKDHHPVVSRVKNGNIERVAASHEGMTVIDSGMRMFDNFEY